MVRGGGGLQRDGSRLAGAIPRRSLQLLQPPFQPQDRAHAGGSGITRLVVVLVITVVVCSCRDCCVGLWNGGVLFFWARRRSSVG